jgi:hypothetical protein
MFGYKYKKGLKLLKVLLSVLWAPILIAVLMSGLLAVLMSVVLFGLLGGYGNGLSEGNKEELTNFFWVVNFLLVLPWYVYDSADRLKSITQDWD